MAGSPYDGEAKDDVDCLDVEEARRQGAPLAGPAAAHAKSCPVCSLGGGGRAGAAPGDFASLFETIHADVARDRSAIGALRSLGTRTRVLLAAFAVAAIAAVAQLRSTNGGSEADARSIVALTAFGALLAVVLRLALRPLHAAPDAPNRARLAAIAAFFVPFVFGLLPTAAELEVLGAHATRPFAAMASCFALGAVVGVGTILTLWALDRGAHQGRSRAVFAAAAGGLAGNLALELHCPITAPAHLLLGHATIGLLLVFAYVGFRGERSR